MRARTNPEDLRLLVEQIGEIAEELNSMSSGFAMLRSAACQPSRASLDQFVGKVETLRRLVDDLGSL